MTPDTFTILCKHISKTMIQLRAAYGFSQEYVAAELGINQNTYSKLETGQTRMTVHRLHQLCELYQKSIDVFLLPANVLDLPDVKKNSPGSSRKNYRHISQSSVGNYGMYLPILPNPKCGKFELKDKIIYSDELMTLLQDIMNILEDMKRKEHHRTIRQFLSELGLFNILISRLMDVATNFTE